MYVNKKGHYFNPLSTRNPARGTGWQNLPREKAAFPVFKTNSATIQESTPAKLTVKHFVFPVGIL